MTRIGVIEHTDNFELKSVEIGHIENGRLFMEPNTLPYTVWYIYTIDFIGGSSRAAWNQADLKPNVSI